jgi:cellulose synthase/poly-beta-1,6-N-acetylglucosamine synthase-like glycosyltransferase
METLFLILLFLSVYSYLIYPGVLFILSRVAGDLWDQEYIRPIVTIIISAYNEESVIEEKIRNTLALDYPKELLEVIVSSDGSNDRTDEIIAGIQDSRLVLRAFSGRSGKTTCINRVAPEAKGNIILFTDANSMFPLDLLVKVVRNFASPNVGLVTGWTKYRNPEGGDETTGIYSKFETWTKYWESLISSCVGADGAIFAIRKLLYRPLEKYDINDFVIPLHVIKQGKRVVIDPEVFCFEKPLKDTKKEYRRQVRITTRTLGAIRRNVEFINPLRFFSFSFFLISHKVMRFLVPFFLIGTFVINFFILKESFFYILTLSGQIFILVVGLIGILGLTDGKLARFIKFFLITASAQLVGWFRMLFGASDTMWTPQR